jgi:hypothetical protein
METSHERIYRIWSAQKEDHISMRVHFAFEEAGQCRIVRLGDREEWAI